MNLRILLLVLAALACTAAWAGADEDPNTLEIWVVEFQGQYSCDFFTRKVGATTCDITTPRGTYACVDTSGSFEPSMDFLLDHESMSPAELLTVIATPWTMVWDSGKPTETAVAMVLEPLGDFPHTPIIVFPQDGANFVNPDPNPFEVVWTYLVDPCVAQVDDWTVWLRGPGGAEMREGFSPSDDCRTTSWTPPNRLSNGKWEVDVYNGIEIRDVPDGLTIEGDPWVLDNDKWLAVSSMSRSNITVPTERATVGKVKYLFR